MKNFIIIIFVFYFKSILFCQNHISIAKTKNDIILRKEPSFFSSENGMKIIKDKEVKVLDFKNNYWLIIKDTIKGWTSSDFLYKTDTMYKILRRYKTDKNINRFGLIVGRKINLGQTWIGMSKEMLLASKGVPSKKNITQIESLKSEQWIYSNKYVYLENEIVTAIQNK